MKITQILCKQHLGYYFKKHWRVQGRIRVRNTGAEKLLQEKGIKVYTPEELFKRERKEYEKIEVVGLLPKPIAYDNTHPDWHDRPLCSFEDHEVPVYGLEQAKALTKTVELKKGLPDKLKLPELDNLSPECKAQFKQTVLSSHVLDAEQKPLPRIKNPDKPAWVDPIQYGITLDRKCRLITNKLTDVISLNVIPELGKQRDYWENASSIFTFETDEKLVQIKSTAEKIRTSLRPLQAVTDENTTDLELPVLHPMRPTLSMTLKNIYKEKCHYPFPNEIKRRQPHTLFMFFNQSVVKNIYEEKVTDSQISGRLLMKTFAHAASFARHEFGENVKVLPKPITIQCVHTDSKMFSFAILQLQTLDMTEGGVKNIWYQSDFIPLFEKCCYFRGRPVLEGYNELPVRHLIAFARND